MYLYSSAFQTVILGNLGFQEKSFGSRRTKMADFLLKLHFMKLILHPFNQLN